MEILKTKLTRRRFLQASGVAGAAGAGYSALSVVPAASKEAHAQAAAGNTVVNKSICGQCPARCGIDIYTTNGKVHAIYGNNGHPIANGKGCPKMHLGTYILYDPDRFKGPMKRTNPKKGRDEDPKFVPISWDEAYKTVGDRLNALRDKGESHRFGLFFGRGWGASDVGVNIVPFGQLYGSPNVPIGHSSICSDGSVLAKQCTDGNASYSSYDYKNANYLLMFGANFLEAFRPYNNNLQVWGYIRGEKTPKTRVTYVDVHMNQTGAAADRALLLKPGTDGALALAIAHVILTEGLWDRPFVGNFKDGENKFKTGEKLDPASFNEKWVKRPDPVVEHRAQGPHAEVGRRRHHAVPPTSITADRPRVRLHATRHRAVRARRPHPQQRRAQRHGDPLAERPGRLAVRRGWPGLPDGPGLRSDAPADPNDFKDSTTPRTARGRRPSRIDLQGP
jgi:thiosulfate reductase/polysulfide reductase chain A